MVAFEEGSTDTPTQWSVDGVVAASGQASARVTLTRPAERTGGINIGMVNQHGWWVCDVSAIQ